MSAISRVSHVIVVHILIKINVSNRNFTCHGNVKSKRDFQISTLSLWCSMNISDSQFYICFSNSMPYNWQQLFQITHLTHGRNHRSSTSSMFVKISQVISHSSFERFSLNFSFVWSIHQAKVDILLNENDATKVPPTATDVWGVHACMMHSCMQHLSR